MTWDQKHPTCINNSDQLKNHHSSQTQASWFCTHACSHTCAHTHTHTPHTCSMHTHTHTHTATWGQKLPICMNNSVMILYTHTCTHTRMHTHRVRWPKKNEYVKQYLCHFHGELSVMTRLIPRKMSGREHPSLCQLKTSNDTISDIYVFLQIRSKESQRNQCACHQHQSNINWLILDDVGF